MRAQWKGITAGVVVGLLWTVGKVAAPLLVKTAIDRGIVADDSGRSCSGRLAIAGAGIVAATFTGLRRYLAFRESRWPSRPAGPAVRPPPAPALRLPRREPDRRADEPGQH